MKRFYLISVSPEQIFYPDAVRNTVVNDSTIDAWWNQISNTFIIRTTQNAQYHASRILASYPGLSFLIVKIDLNEYNGYLPQVAWDWIRAHSEPKPTYKTLPPSPLLDMLKRTPTTGLPPIGSPDDPLKAVFDVLKKRSEKG